MDAQRKKDEQAKLSTPNLYSQRYWDYHSKGEGVMVPMGT